MKTILTCIITILLLNITQLCSAQPLQECWFFAFGHKRNRKDVEEIKSLIKSAADHGFNGMVLSSMGLDSITRWKEEDIARLKEIEACCTKNRIELIPTGLSAGYGGGALGHDRNLAAALPTTLSLKAEDGRITPVKAKNLLVNGDLEEHSGNRFKGFNFHDEPGKVSFADTLAVSGKSSIRFENYGAGEHGHGRMMQKVGVIPGRSYRFSFKIKTEAVQPVSGLKAMVLANGRSLASMQPKVKPTGEWCDVSLDFINSSETEVLLYAGIWGGRSGKFWIDDMRFYEFGDLTEIVRRKGTPLSLSSRDRKKIFQEGRDFRAIRCLHQLDYITIPPGSAIKEGENLELACYKIPYIMHSWGKQESLCMSNPALLSTGRVRSESCTRSLSSSGSCWLWMRSATAAAA